MKKTLLYFLFSCTLLWQSSALAVAQPPQTGQATCFDQIGTPLPCIGTGQDGDVKAGVAWPGQRFTDNGDGTLTDTLTGLMWVKDTGTSGANDWQGMLDYVKTQNALIPPYLGHTDWRLPNASELASLVNYEEATPRTWLNTVGLLNMPANQFFWSSTSDQANLSDARVVQFDTGLLESRPKSGSGYALLVRGPVGAATVHLPQTGQTLCYDAAGLQVSCTGTGQDGEFRNGLSWAEPRFTNNGGVSLTDNVTGLTWTRDANLMAQFNPSFDNDGTSRDGAVTWQHALDFTNSLNAVNFLGFQDWRLPNFTEFTSLLNSGLADQTAWLTQQGFVNVPSGTTFAWSATSFPSNSGQALNIDLDSGTVLHSPKSAFGLAWPVRGGFYGDAVLSLAPDSLAFGTVIMGGISADRILVISNKSTGRQNLTVNSLTVTGPDSGLFTIVPGGTNPCPTLTPTILPGANCTLTASFAPLTAGNKNAAISLTTNALAASIAIPLTGKAVDGDPPVGTFVIDNSAPYTASSSVSLTMNATDNSDTVTEMRFSNDNVAWGPWTGYATNANWTLAANDGFKTVFAQFRDATGNVSNTAFANIILRSAPPQALTISGLPASGFTNATALVLTANSPEAVNFSYTLNPGTPAGATLAPAQNVAVPIKTQMVLTNLPEGTYTLTASGGDVAGNSQLATTVVTWTVDRTPPALTINPSSILSPTNAPNPSINGTVEPGTQNVGISVGATFLGFATISGSSWTFQLSGLVNGSNTITAVATDIAGNSHSVSAAIVFDNAPPTATITASSITSTSTPPATTASAASFTVGGTGVVSYRYKLDAGAYVGDAITGIPVDTTIPLASLTEGTHTLSVIGRDLAGNWQASASASIYTWKVDTVAPTFSITQPGSPTSTSPISVSLASISEAVTVTIRNEANGASQSLSSNTAAAVFNNLPLLAGSNRLSVSAVDAAGNMTTSSVTVVLAQNAPTAIIGSSFASGSTVTANAATFTISGAGVVEYQWKRVDSAGASCVQSGYSALTPVSTLLAVPTTGTLADGSYTLCVIGKDAAGNLQTQGAAASITWTVDSVAPTATVTGGPPAITSATFANFAVTPNAGVVAYKYAVDSGEYPPAEIDVNTTISLTGLGNGPHTIFVIGRDLIGNWQKTPTSVTWTVDRVSPGVTIDPPANPTNNLKITGTTEKGSTVSIALDGVTKGNATIKANGIDWDFTLSAVATGSHTVKATATDTAGNSSNTSVALNYDGTAPAVTITGNPVEFAATGATSAVFTVSANKPLATYTYHFVPGGASETAKVAASQPILLTGLNNNNYTLTVTAHDLAGNSAVKTYQWTVDTTLPPANAVISGGVPAYKSGDTAASVSIDPTSASSYRFILSTKPAGTVLASPENTIIANPFLTPATIDIASMPEGTYILEVFGSVDGAAFQQQPTRVAWIVDRTPPVAVKVSNVPASGYTNATTLSLGVSGDDLVSYRLKLKSAPGGVVLSPLQDTETTISQPIVFTSLPEGDYTVAIIGKDTAGNWQVAPAPGWENSPAVTTASFTVDRTLPVLTLNPVTTPTNSINQTLIGTVDDVNAVIVVSASTSAFGGKATVSAGTPPTWSFDLKGLVKGANVITVTATDRAGNPASTSGTITLATDLPLATVTGVPPAITSTTGAALTIAGTNVVNYKYKLDGDLNYSIVTPISNQIILGPLADGRHTVAVVGQDIAGNWQESPTVVSWRVLTAAPVATVTPDSPPSPVNAKSITFAVGGTDVISYQYKLDGNNWSAETPLKTPISLTNLANGSHLLSVVGRNLAGTWQPQGSPTDVAWTVQLGNPDLDIDVAAITTPTNAASALLQGTVTVVGATSLNGVSVFNALTNTTVAAAINGNIWSVASLALAAGSNPITVTATDSAGNTASRKVTIERLGTAPTAQVMAGTPRSQTNDSSVNLTIGGSGVVAYQYRLDNGSWSSESPVNAKLAISGLTDGLHSLSLVGKDLAGNWQDQATPTTISWAVDTVPPLLTIDKPTSPTRLTSQTISGTAEPGCSIKVTTNTVALGGTIASQPGTWNMLVTGLAAGSNTITVTETDPAGNSTAVALTIEYDTSAPTARIDGVPQGTTRNSAATLTVSGVGVVTYRWSIDNGPFSSDTAVSESVTLANLADGQHTLLVYGKKISGLEQSNPTSVTWTVDTSAPTATVTGAPPAQTNLTGATLKVGDSDVVAYRFSLDGGPFSSEIPVATDIKLTNLAVGNHLVQVVGRDAVGNWQQLPTPVSWIIDTTPPSLTLNEVLPRTTLTSQIITGTVESTALLAISTSTAATVSAPKIVGSAWSATITSLAMGANVITLTATDVAGNKATLSTTITRFTPPITTLAGLPPADAPTNATSFTVLVAGEGAVAYKYSLDGGTYSDLIDVSTPIQLNNVAEGMHTLSVIGRDISGGLQNPATTASWLVDLTPPQEVVISGMPANPTPANFLALTIGGQDVSSYSYRLDNGSYTPFLPIDTSMTATGMSDGSHTLAVRGRDRAGNVQVTPTTFNWVIDTIAPVTSLTPPGGVFDHNQVVTLTSNEPATIFYTMDGTSPNTGSPVYSAPLTISRDTVIRFFAMDPAGNQEASRTQSYTFAANGDINGDGLINIGDAVMALQVASKMKKPTAPQLARGDVAPLRDRKPNSDGVVNIGDVVVILQLVVGLVKF